MNIGNIWCWFVWLHYTLLLAKISNIAFSKDYFTQFISLPFPAIFFCSIKYSLCSVGIMSVCRTGLWAHVLVPANNFNVTFSLWFSPLEGLDWRSWAISSKKFLFAREWRAWPVLGNVNVGFPTFLLFNWNKYQWNKVRHKALNLHYFKKLPKSKYSHYYNSSFWNKAGI